MARSHSNSTMIPSKELAHGPGGSYVSLRTTTLPWLGSSDTLEECFDLTVITSDKKLFCLHSAVLASMSSYFALLSQDERQDDGNIVITVELPSEYMKLIVNFLYHGILPMTLGPDICVAFHTMGIRLQEKKFTKASLPTSTETSMMAGRTEVKEESEVSIKDDAEENMKFTATQEIFQEEQKIEQEEEDAALSEYDSDDDEYLPNVAEEAAQEKEDAMDESSRVVERPLSRRTTTKGRVLKFLGYCKDCKKEVDNLPRHKVDVHNYKRVCKPCPHCKCESFDLEYHIMNFHEKSFCPECKKEFKNRPAMLKHSNQAHQSWCCEECGKVLTTEMNLLHHKLRLHAPKEDREFKCHFCPRAYTSKVKWEMHMETHSESKNHVCELCGHAVNSRQALYMHRAACKKAKASGRKYTPAKRGGQGRKGMRVKLIQNPEKHPPFVLDNVERLNVKEALCKICKKVFKHSASVEKAINHIYSMHMDDDKKPFQCELCGKGFAREASYQYHMEIHENKRGYQCSYCNKGFNQIANRNSHEREVHLNIKKGSTVNSRRNGGRKKLSSETKEERMIRWQTAAAQKVMEDSLNVTNIAQEVDEVEEAESDNFVNNGQGC